MILTDRVGLRVVTGTEKVMDEETFEYVTREVAVDHGTVPAYVGAGTGQAKAESLGGSLTAWLPEDQIAVMLPPVYDLPDENPTQIRVRWRDRTWTGMGVQLVHRNGRPHHVTVRCASST